MQKNADGLPERCTVKNRKNQIMKRQPSANPWKTISSKYLFRQPWLTVRCEEVELPNGRKIPDYYILEYPEWVNVIAITANGQFIFVHQYRHGLRQSFYEIPAGVCEKSDHSPLDMAKRELQEETGFGGGEWTEFMTLSANPTSQTNLTHTFLARNVIPVSSQKLDPGEHLTIHLFSPDEVLELLLNGKIVQALMAAPLWKYFYEKRQEKHMAQ